MASLSLSDDELRRLALELAPLLAAALPAHDDAPAGWLDAKAAAAYAGCTVNALHKAMAAREVEFRQETRGGKAWFRAEWLDRWRGLQRRAGGAAHSASRNSPERAMYAWPTSTKRPGDAPTSRGMAHGECTP